MRCKICNREFQDYISLGSHIGQTHKDIGLKGYYDRFLKTNNEEGICKNPDCKKETKFIYLTFGYNLYCSRNCSNKMRDYKQSNSKRGEQICQFCGEKFKNLVALSAHINHPNSIHKDISEIIKIKKEKNKNIKCKICDKKYKTLKGLGIHIVQFHGNGNKNIKQKYYDKYLKKEPTDGICKTCGKETKFLLLTKGYNIYCNTRCSKLDPEVEQKSQKTCLKNHGVTNYAKTKEWSKQMINGQAQMMSAKVGTLFATKPQKEIFEMVKLMYPEAELEYWENKANKRIDIVIKKLKIAIEYDGWYWHKDTLESDNERQKLLESFGWKFIKYKGIKDKDIIPSRDQLKEDIRKLL